MKSSMVALGELTKIRTGKLDANAANHNGAFPFFTCAVEPLSINTAAFDCKAVLVAGNGDLNVKYYEGKFNAYQRTYVIESMDESKLHPKYLYLYLDKYVAKLREQAVGGVIKYIKLENLTNAKIPLPTLEEQKRIATILDKAYEIKAKREQVIAKLDELAQSTFLEMFGDPVLNIRKFDSRKLQDVSDFENGDRSINYPSGDDIKENGVLFLSTKNIRDNKLNLDSSQFITEEKYKSLSRGKVKDGDLIITLRGTLGSCCVFNVKNSEAFINAQMMIIRPKQMINNTYLHGLITSNSFQKQLQRISNGAAVQQLTASQLKELLILVPPLNQQNTFKQAIEVITKVKAKLIDAVKDADILVQSLQHQAFTTGLNA